jgi:hypothetical protein
MDPSQQQKKKQVKDSRSRRKESTLDIASAFTKQVSVRNLRSNFAQTRQLFESNKKVSNINPMFKENKEQKARKTSTSSLVSRPDSKSLRHSLSKLLGTTQKSLTTSTGRGAPESKKETHSTENISEKVAVVPIEGVSLRVLEQVLIYAEHQRRETGDPTITTQQVWDYVLEPVTKPNKISVVTLLQNYVATSDNNTHPILGGNADDVGNATVFVSLACGGSFREVVESLRAFLDDNNNTHTKKNTFFWVCNIVINQHIKLKDGFANAFDVMIGSIGTMVCVLESWDDPKTLKRLWCLWEVYCAGNILQLCTLP